MPLFEEIFPAGDGENRDPMHVDEPPAELPSGDIDPEFLDLDKFPFDMDTPAPLTPQ